MDWNAAIHATVAVLFGRCELASVRGAGVRPNYRMRASGLGRLSARGTDHKESTPSLAGARLGLQVMRGRPQAFDFM